VTHLSDPELVRRTLQGDTAAFGTLVERYKQVVFGVCVSLLGDFALAQDLAQDTFLKAFQHVHRLAMPERFGNWLCIIARNECRLYLRQAHASEAPRRTFYDQASSGQAHLVPAEQQQELRHQQDYHERLGAAALQALQTLSEKNRQVLTLYYLSGYSLKELGALLGISPATAKMRLHRARQHLRKEAITMVENALTQQQLGPHFTARIQVADMTILFTDMAGSTRLLEQLPPEEALTLLYTYMNAIAQLLVDYGATLENVAGDAIIHRLLGGADPQAGPCCAGLPGGPGHPDRDRRLARQTAAGRQAGAARQMRAAERQALCQHPELQGSPGLHGYGPRCQYGQPSGVGERASGHVDSDRGGHLSAGPGSDRGPRCWSAQSPWVPRTSHRRCRPSVTPYNWTPAMDCPDTIRSAAQHSWPHHLR
jgi:RNA polymerase sigma factor (sigma-70 family)